jgi:hypothetical protein
MTWCMMWEGEGSLRQDAGKAELCALMKQVSSRLLSERLAGATTLLQRQKRELLVGTPRVRSVLLCEYPLCD